MERTPRYINVHFTLEYHFGVCFNTFLLQIQQPLLEFFGYRDHFIHFKRVLSDVIGILDFFFSVSKNGRNLALSLAP